MTILRTRAQLIFTVVICGLTISAYAKHAPHHHGGHQMVHHGAHAQFMHRSPSTLMGSHLMNEGGWMTTYRYMRMEMDGNRDDRQRLSPAEVRSQGFPVVPTRMVVDMHMVGAMYGVTNRVTALGMLPYLDKEMDHLAGQPLGSVEFTTTSDGIGDIKVGGLIGVFNRQDHSLHANVLISLPTGSIDERDAPPGQLPYPMQLGSGTYDLMPGLTYTVHKPDYSWGVQGMATLRLGDNDRDYTLGDRFNLTGWYSREVAAGWVLGMRLEFNTWGNIDGADAELNPAVVPTADPDRRAGDRWDIGVGVTKLVAGWQFGVDVKAPLEQDLDGPQLETDHVLTVSVKKHL